MVVDSVDPVYYAYGRFAYRFTLYGSGFVGLPSNAVAIPMADNDNPLQYRNTVVPAFVMTIENVTPNSVTFSSLAEGDHGRSSIGAILSNDRETVYWVNNSRPLP